MAALTPASVADVRAHIARALLGSAVATASLGSITLLPHQRDGVARIRRMLDQHGGALLADDVGLGKTFVALAIASEVRSALVIAPASVRSTWLDAAARTRVSIHILSMEQLSRGQVDCGEHDLVIVDEAHHFRSVHTRRFAEAAALCDGARVLLLSATPVQNRLDDLRAMLSLFLGQRSFAMAHTELVAFVVRRVDAQATALPLPVVAPPQWLDLPSDVDCLDRLMHLPPPIPASDEGDAGILLTYTLARQWASSRAALRGALARRLARARALEDAIVAGRMPTKHELTAWTLNEVVQQLSFPELVVSSSVASSEALLRQVREHAAGVRSLLHTLDDSADPDIARATSLRELLRAHAGERIVAFSEYRDTIAALYRLLLPHARVAMLTHSGAHVAGGTMSRAELLTRFAPGSSQRTAAAERIDLLLTTDVLSEGVNLQDASVVVHLDLAWNPARLEQRVGRLRRLGAARDVVRVYMMSPPAPSERLLRLEQRLRIKLDEAARAVGLAGAILPGVSVARSGATDREERITAALRSWDREVPVTADVLSAAVRGSVDAALACVIQDGRSRLIAVVNDAVTTDRAIVEQLVADAGDVDVELPLRLIERTHAVISTWLRSRCVSDVVDLTSLRAGRARRHVLHRVDDIARRAPRHVRPRLSPLFHAVRSVASGALSAGAERVLADLADASLPDEAWLHALGEFAALHAQAATAEPRVVAILMLRYLPALSSNRV